MRLMQQRRPAGWMPIKYAAGAGTSRSDTPPQEKWHLVHIRGVYVGAGVGVRADPSGAALWRSQEQRMSAKELFACARRPRLKMNHIHSMDVVLPLDTGADLRRRTVFKPDKALSPALHQLGLNLPRTRACNRCNSFAGGLMPVGKPNTVLLFQVSSATKACGNK